MKKNKKIVLITGASSGIGAATVDKVIEAGHKAVITARSTDKLNEIVKRWGKDKVLGKIWLLKWLNGRDAAQSYVLAWSTLPSLTKPNLTS